MVIGQDQVRNLKKMQNIKRDQQIENLYRGYREFFWSQSQWLCQKDRKNNNMG